MLTIIVWKKNILLHATSHLLYYMAGILLNKIIFTKNAKMTVVGMNSNSYSFIFTFTPI